MNIKLELLKKDISELVESNIENIDIDADKIANTNAISALYEIKSVICDEKLSDFMVVDEIVNIFEKYKINSGGRHDF